MTTSALVSSVATTPLGAVTLEVGGSSMVAIDVAHADTAELPDGMAVDGVLLFSVRLQEQVTPSSPARLSASADHEGGPETGEWLDSMGFEIGSGVMQVAVRDDEWLAAHGITADPVQYEKRGFSQLIREAAAGTVLYASVAWRVHRSVTANDGSAWFAADLGRPH